MRMLATNALHDLAEQLKVNCEALEATLELTPDLDSGIRRWLKSLIANNGDKVARAYHTIDEIETIADEGEK